MEAWQNLPFNGFDKLTEERRREWERYATEIADSEDNIGLVADTAAGKTIIAILAILPNLGRTLFLAPTRILVDQHRKLWQRIVGGSEGIHVITGDVDQKNRDWNHIEHRVIFATPQSLLLGLEKKTVDMEGFSLLVLDEFHLATNDYPYTQIAKMAKSCGTRILGLTASPGANGKEINGSVRSAGLDRTIEAKIKTPKKSEEVGFAKPDQFQKEIERDLTELLQRYSREIWMYGGENLDREPSSSIATLKATFERLKGQTGREKARARNACAICFYIRHALNVALSDSYFTFLEYAERLRQKDSWPTRVLFSEDLWRKTIRTARRRGFRHPKVIRFLKTVKFCVPIGKTGIVFIGNKVTGRYLVELLNRLSIPSEFMMSEASKSGLERQAELLKKLERREITILVSTSVIEMGVSVPEVDFVINYAMPMTEVARIQRNGRTGRLNRGRILNILLDHETDKGLYWNARRGEKNMRKVMSDQSLPLFQNL